MSVSPPPIAVATASAQTSPTPSPAATPFPDPVWTRPSPGVEPVPPEGPLALSASAERDGVRITITLDRDPVPAGEPTWVTTELTNIGADDLIYAGDGCGPRIHVGGSMPDIGWRPGLEWPGKAGDYKEWGIDRRDLTDGVIHIGFVPAGFVEQGLEAGEYGCADLMNVKRLAPGATAKNRERWSGLTMRTYAPPPTGLVTIQGTFHFYWREAEGERDPPRAFERRITVDLDAWVIGVEEPPIVHPAEAIDIALADPEFSAWLLRRPFRNGADFVVKYDSRARTWHVGLLSYYPRERTRAAVIDAVTGELIALVGPVD